MVSIIAKTNKVKGRVGNRIISNFYVAFSVHFFLSRILLLCKCTFSSTKLFCF